MSLFSMTLSMFLIMNSVGHLPGYFELVSAMPRKKRLVIVVREMLIALFIMVFFHFIGFGFLFILLETLREGYLLFLLLVFLRLDLDLFTILLLYLLEGKKTNKY